MFLQDPNILLIDEGTAALDPQTEAYIKNRIEKKFANRTVIIIAWVFLGALIDAEMLTSCPSSHRLSSIKDVDRILVLEESGRIIKDGRHDDLLKSDGVYALS